MVWMCLLVLSEAHAIAPPKKGGMFPDIVLPVPQDAGEREYLGLPESGQFKIPQIKAQVVIVEVFNMY
jgi:hypothetical protein